MPVYLYYNYASTSLHTMDYHNDQHPELRPGEMVLRNTSNPNLISVLPFNYVREGILAYTQKGDLVSGYSPVFVKIGEWKQKPENAGKQRPDDSAFEPVANRAPLQPKRPVITAPAAPKEQREIPRPAIMQDRTTPVHRSEQSSGNGSHPVDSRFPWRKNGSTAPVLPALAQPSAPKTKVVTSEVLIPLIPSAPIVEPKRVQIRTFCDRDAVRISGADDDARKDDARLLTGEHWMEERMIGNVVWLVCPADRIGIPKRLAEDSDDPVYGKDRIQILQYS
jgi:hypothetical protein